MSDCEHAQLWKNEETGVWRCPACLTRFVPDMPGTSRESILAASVRRQAEDLNGLRRDVLLARRYLVAADAILGNPKLFVGNRLRQARNAVQIARTALTPDRELDRTEAHG